LTSPDLGASSKSESRVASDIYCNQQGLLLKASARNIVTGKVTAVAKGEVAALVKVEVKQPFTFTSMITKEAVNDLNLKKGDRVSVMIKSTEVMILKE